MKRNKIPYHPKLPLICTDGSTFESNFPYYKDELFINPDIKSNTLWLPAVKDAELKKISNKSSKFINYDFNFESLIKPVN
jgi:hypothetical protein